MMGWVALCLAGAALAEPSPAWLQPRGGSGSPGTATPQPYTQPAAPPVPRTPSGNPPLLRNGGGALPGTPERPLPQLERPASSPPTAPTPRPAPPARD